MFLNNNFHVFECPSSIRGRKLPAVGQPMKGEDKLSLKDHPQSHSILNIILQAVLGNSILDSGAEFRILEFRNRVASPDPSIMES